MADQNKPANSPKQGDKNISDLPQKNIPSKQSEDVKGGRMPEKIKP